MFFDDIVERITKEVSGFHSLHEIVAEIRSRLQFNDKPSWQMMAMGEVDCVGAATIAAQILQLLDSTSTYQVVGLPRLPWVRVEIADSKHCAVLRSDRAGFQVIDPTPINGYGYGRISKSLSNLDLVKDDYRLILNSEPPINDHLFWENFLYPEFILIDEKEIMKILAIDHARYCLSNNQSFILRESDVPKVHVGWIKEFWRTLAQASLKLGDVGLASKYYKLALAASSGNPYLLSEYSKLLKASGNTQELKKVKAKGSEIRKILVSDHSVAEQLWSSLASKALKSEDWYEYLYYLGSAFWRRQSIDLLVGKVPENILSIQLGTESIPLYRFSPSWFKRRNMRLGLTFSQKLQKNKNLCTIDTQIEQLRLQFINKYLDVKVDDSQNAKIVIFHRNQESDMPSDVQIANNFIMAHKWLCGLMKPELLIC